MFTHHGGMGKRLLAGQAARAGTFAVAPRAERLYQCRQRFRCRVRRLLLRAHRKPEAAGLRSHGAHEGSRQDLAHRQGAASKMWASRVPNHGRWRRSRRCARSTHSRRRRESSAHQAGQGLPAERGVGLYADDDHLGAAQPLLRRRDHAARERRARSTSSPRRRSAIRKVLELIRRISSLTIPRWTARATRPVTPSRSSCATGPCFPRGARRAAT